MIGGLCAGAVGTVALNIVTYADMAARGRPPSEVPANVVRALAERLDWSYFATPQAESDERLKQRRSAIGALMGYGVGLSVGALYGVLRPVSRSLPWPVAAAVLAAIAMASSDVPATRLGVTATAEWSAVDWLSDLVPHLAYGTATALSLRYFTSSK